MKYRKLIKYSTLGLVFSLAASLPAFAKHPSQHVKHKHNTHVVYQTTSTSANHVAPVVGAIIGAVIGKQISQGNANVVNTIGGAAIGNQISHLSHQKTTNIVYQTKETPRHYDKYNHKKIAQHNKRK